MDEFSRWRIYAGSSFAAQSGDHRKALALLTQASNLAPRWPYPVYDMAYAFLLMEDADNAWKYYRKTLELAPRGFFTAITAVDTLERERRGDLPAGTYRACLSLEGLNEPREKSEMLQLMVRHVPDFAPAWKDFAKTLDTASEALAAIEKGLEADPDSETRGMLLINKALVLNRQSADGGDGGAHGAQSPCPEDGGADSKTILKCGIVVLQGRIIHRSPSAT
jgi:tetratricopeptide (TPR) repeat protein